MTNATAMIIFTFGILIGFIVGVAVMVM